MPRRTDIETIMLIGSGPIVIGQGCEFDYSGAQACKALRADGYRIVLLNSNPATIMTDPEYADRTYIEPITTDIVDRILQAERDAGRPVDALLPTLGGQTALNCAMEAVDAGVLERHGVELIGASPTAIARAEDRTLFREAMIRIGQDVPRSGAAHSLEEALELLEEIGLPCCVRAAYTLGGAGSGFCRTREEFIATAARGIGLSRINEVLVEESLYGWKEFELEVIRDRRDNFIVVCSIENIDPMGVHTGDSITVAPSQTLTDREFQQMRESAKAVVREIGVDTGGCNVQFAVHPRTGRQVVIEMNPRVSRSSALASKATGYPIAKVAAKLAVGYTLDEIPNEITGTTPASFEPVLDYCVIKMPRWAFEKFPEADETLTTQMKSVGEAMAIGRTFKEAWQKCIRSMEVKRAGYGLDGIDKWLASHPVRRRADDPRSQPGDQYTWLAPPPQSSAVSNATGGASSSSGSAHQAVFGSKLGEAPPDILESSADQWPVSEAALKNKLETPCQGRPYYIRYAFKLGWSIERVHEATHIDVWFLDQLKQLVEFEDELLAAESLDGEARVELLGRARMYGYSNAQLQTIAPSLLEIAAPPAEAELATAGGGSAAATGVNAIAPRSSFRLVDTCAAEFEAGTPYYYSTHEAPILHFTERGIAHRFDDELEVQPQPHVIVIGGGPNRIGQGIEFDYCCVHAVAAARELGYRTVMINSNPETVSTDYDTSDMLFIEPLTIEDVHRVIHAIAERGEVQGCVVQFGGQTPINLARPLIELGAPILGTSPDSIDLAEDRESFSRILRSLGLRQPPAGIADNRAEARAIAQELGYPVLIRPSYVLGGRAMELCNNEDDLDRYIDAAFAASDVSRAPGSRQSILVDKFLLDATEIDVDAVADYRSPDDPDGECVIAGVMEHIEEAGIHSGDSTCALPPHSLSSEHFAEIERQTAALARKLGVCGLMNVQFAIAAGEIYVLEVNPRASRTVPFVSKATGIPWPRVAMKVMLGRSLRDVLWEMGVGRNPRPLMHAVKAPVFPFKKFPGVDMVLGPEMRSTGEVMGVDASFELAFAKAAVSTELSLPAFGNALVSVNDPDKPRIIPIARDLQELGFKLFATIGTHRVLKEAGIPSVVVSKQAGAPEGFLLDLINHGVLDLLINTPVHYGPAWEEGRWRAAATARGLPLITTVAGAKAAVGAIRATKRNGGEVLTVRALQDYIAGVL